MGTGREGWRGEVGMPEWRFCCRGVEWEEVEYVGEIENMLRYLSVYVPRGDVLRGDDSGL